MGKKKISVLGSENEDSLKAKKAVKLQQKKFRREGSIPPTPSLPSSPSESPAPSIPASQPKSTKQARVRSKTYTASKSQVDPTSTYPLTQALDLLRKVSYSKFDATVELHLTLKERGFNQEVDLPHSTGKTRRVAIADDATVAQIEAGKIEFDVLLASPAQMARLVKLAKVLGPRGLMPNPKTGTVVPDPAATAKTLASKVSVYLKTEKDAPLIHTSIGKLSMPDTALSANIQAILAVLPGKLTKVVLKSTHSPALKIAF